MISVREISGCHKIFGLSSDTKPTLGVTNGDIYVEINTCKAYFWDGQNKTWIQIPDSKIHVSI